MLSPGARNTPTAPPPRSVVPAMAVITHVPPLSTASVTTPDTALEPGFDTAIVPVARKSVPPSCPIVTVYVGFTLPLVLNEVGLADLLMFQVTLYVPKASLLTCRRPGSVSPWRWLPKKIVSVSLGRTSVEETAPLATV